MKLPVWFKKKIYILGLKRLSDFMDFGTFDIEATDWIKPYLLGSYNGSDFQYFKGRTLIADYLDWELSEPVRIVYAHNGGKYDFKFLVKYILENKHKNNLLISPLFVNGSIISLKVYKKSPSGKSKKLIKEFRDSFVLMPSSLLKLTNSFDVEHKKLNMTDEDYQCSKVTDEKIKYLRYDCMGLYECLKYFIEFSELEGTIPLTISSCAMSIYRHRFQSNFPNIIKSMRIIETEIRHGYYGGRVEVFKRYGENLNYYDVNSLYPHSMHKKSYPIGTFIEVGKFSDNLLGIYHCNVSAPDDIDILLLPCKTDDGLVFGTGTFTGWYTTPEIQEAVKNGYDIKVNKGYVWTEQSNNLFTSYIDYFYNKKKNSTGAKRYIAKTYLTSLYGKFAQRRDRKKILFSIDKNDLYDVEVLDDELGIYAKDFIQLFSDTIRPILSIYTTAYARIHMFRLMQNIGLDKLYYTDTDSLITTKKMPVSSRLGDLKLEHTLKKGIFLQPKLYSCINNKDEYILRAKGFHVASIKYSDYEKALFKNDFSGFSQNRFEMLGFLESLRRKNTDKILATYHKPKINKGAFTKRILINRFETKPIKLKL